MSLQILFARLFKGISVLIRDKICRDIEPSADTGVAGVCGMSSRRLGLTITLLATDTGDSGSGHSTDVSTLSGSNANKPLPARQVLVYLAVNAFSPAGLNRDVKCFLPIILTPSRSNRSSCSQ